MNDSEYQIDQPTKQAKKIAWLVLGLVAIAFVVVAVYYFTKINAPASRESHEVQFQIQKGTTSKSIAQELARKKVISNTWVFLAYTTLHGAGNKIEAGQYVLNSNMPITEIVDILTHGRVVAAARNITTIEGWTNAQVATELVQRQIITKPVQLADLLQKTQFDFKYNDPAKSFNYQGFLFPDTYTIADSQGAETLVKKMLANFESKITDQMLKDIKSAGRNLKDVIILASIIEKEVGRNTDVVTADDLALMQKERQNVASVFYNRLQVGMGLESDATINYITGKKDRQPLISDTRINSPYNTYKFPGLPPGPISNPGLRAIMAAIYPADTHYLYFINKTDGEAVFGKTLAEHNANKAKYLK